MALRPYQDEELNYFKFSSLVLNEFPKALRQTFKIMWDNTYGHRPGFQLWDDSPVVRNLFVYAEGGTTKVPTHQSYNEWDCTALFQATIFAQSFASPGSHKTLSDLYVKPRHVPHGSFHTSVVRPGGNNAETFALAIDQLRLLRNSLCHSPRPEMDKKTFDQHVQDAKNAFKALGVTTTVIDTVGNLTESDFPTNEVHKLKQRIWEEFSLLEELRAESTAIKLRFENDTASKEDIAMLQQNLKEFTKAKVQDDERDTHANEILENVSLDINDLKSNSAAIKQRVESDVSNKEDIAMLEQRINELKIAQSEQSMDMSSAMDELKHKLEQKIDELRAAQDVGDDQSRNPGTNLKLALITE